MKMCAAQNIGSDGRRERDHTFIDGFQDSPLRCDRTHGRPDGNTAAWRPRLWFCSVSRHGGFFLFTSSTWTSNPAQLLRHTLWFSQGGLYKIMLIKNTVHIVKKKVRCNAQHCVFSGYDSQCLVSVCGVLPRYFRKSWSNTFVYLTVEATISVSGCLTLMIVF